MKLACRWCCRCADRLRSSSRTGRSGSADSLRRLEKLQLFAKKAVIEGLAKTIAHDDVLNVAEAELLRTVCAALHCPLPPLLPGLIR